MHGSVTSCLCVHCSCVHEFKTFSLIDTVLQTRLTTPAKSCKCPSTRLFKKAHNTGQKLQVPIDTAPPNKTHNSCHKLQIPIDTAPQTRPITADQRVLSTFGSCCGPCLGIRVYRHSQFLAIVVSLLWRDVSLGICSFWRALWAVCLQLLAPCLGSRVYGDLQPLAAVMGLVWGALFMWICSV